MIQSYLSHDGRWFNVSTANRRSSVLGDDSTYAETLVWEWCQTLQKRGALIHSAAGMEGSLKRHFDVCDSLHKSGSPTPTEEGE